MKKSALIFVVLLATATHAFAAKRVRIAVFGLFHPKTLAVEALPQNPLRLKAGQEELTLGVSGRGRIVIAGRGRTVLLRDVSRSISANDLDVRAQRSGDDADFILLVPGKIRRQFHGTLLIEAQEGELMPVVEMDLEVAVSSIVAAEAPPGAPLEALKAQAVVSRSYLVASGKRHVNADFCDTTHCQFIRRPPAKTSAAAIAAAETEGMVLAWQARPFAAMYSASCGGRTRTVAESGSVVRDYPYFAVECPYCRRSPEHWSSTVRSGEVKEHDGEAARVRAGRKLGWSAVPSSNFGVKRNQDGSLELTGVGRGHGIGLCQFGAAEMAREGKDFRAILAHYFPNTTLQSV